MENTNDKKKILGGKVEIIGGTKESRDKFAQGLENHIVKELNKAEANKIKIYTSDEYRQKVEALEEKEDIAKFLYMNIGFYNYYGDEISRKTIERDSFDLFNIEFNIPEDFVKLEKLLDKKYSYIWEG